MGYVVFSKFQIDPRSEIQRSISYQSDNFNKCKNFCDEAKRKGSLADFYIYKKGEYPMGYLISHKMISNSGCLYSC